MTDDDRPDLIFESLGHGTSLRRPTCPSEWILIDDEHVVEAEEKR